MKIRVSRFPFFLLLACVLEQGSPGCLVLTPAVALLIGQPLSPCCQLHLCWLASLREVPELEDRRMTLGSHSLQRSITGTSAAPGMGATGRLLAEVLLRCSDDWLQGMLKAPQELGLLGIGVSVGVHAFLCFFRSLIF